MPQFRVVPSVKFEVFFPATYTDPTDPTGTPQYVQVAEIIEYLREITVRYGGYTVSNPYAPPPYSGGYQGGPEERNFWAMIVVADDQLRLAVHDVQQMVSFFQEKYHQEEILCYYHHVNRYVPERPDVPERSS